MWGCLPFAIEAGPRPWTLDRYQHIAWTGKNDAPTGVSALAQTTDGYLWIGSNLGLYRFDGLRFQKIEATSAGSLPALPIYSLHASHDGGLWISYETAGLFFLKNGHVTRFGPKEGAPERRSAQGFAEDTEGQLWMWTSTDLFKFDGARWQNKDADFGLGKEGLSVVFIDHRGNFWWATEHGLHYRAVGTPRAISLKDSGFAFDIKQRQDGTVWVSYLQKFVERWDTSGLEPRLEPGTMPTSTPGFIQFDNGGGLWINGLGDGIRHIASSAIDEAPSVALLSVRVEKFDSTDGLSGDFVWPILRDREGNMWVGTGAGVDRFSPSNFTLAPFPRSGHDFALAADSNGAVYSGSSSKPVIKLDEEGQLRSFDIPPVSLAAFTDQDGTVYFGANSGIWRMGPDAPQHISNLPSAERRDVLALVKGADGVMWVAIAGHLGQLYALDNGRWSILPNPCPGLVPDPPISMHKDHQGRVWMGCAGNHLVVANVKNITMYGPKQGISIGDVNAFQEDAQRLWVGGTDGLGYMSAGQLIRVTLLGLQPLKNISGLVFAKNGDLWIHSLDGVYDIQAKDVREVERNPSYVLSFRKFDTSDGLPGAPGLQYPLPSAIESSDGRIWFATNNGVVWLDPSQLVSNAVPPPVVIDSVEADQKIYVPEDGVALPPLTKTIQINFSALSLTLPEHVRVKVKLHGVDSDWHDLGTQRKISYSNLAPGHYQFQVIAANNDGVWNMEGTSLRFTITPMFYQTKWFEALVAMVIGFMLWLAFAWRVRRGNRRLRAELETRHAERERIARDLHDTILQSFPALLMKVEAGLKKLPITPMERSALDQTLDEAHDVITESRDQVARLRAQYTGTLTDILTIFIDRQEDQFPVTIEMAVSGDVRDLKEETLPEVCFIIQEAILNGCKHAGATHISATLAYRSSGLSATIQDDGVGLDSKLLADGSKPGHWGIRGMKERAKQISATLSFRSRLGEGTVVELWVPRRTAYVSRSIMRELFSTSEP